MNLTTASRHMSHLIAADQHTIAEVIVLFLDDPITPGDESWYQ
jgi:hypothetical protein